MIKITFEVSEDFVNENLSHENAFAKISAADGKTAIQILFDIIGLRALKSQVDKGKKEFVVTPDKLDEKSMQLYDITLGNVCLLASFSETDKKNETPAGEESITRL